MNLYGYLAQFESAEAVEKAAHAAWAEGYRNMDAFAPYPIPELSEAVGHPTSRLPWLIFGVAISGGLGAFFMQWYATVVSYPLNVAGRPLASMPSYFPITFELTVLSATLCGFIAMLWANGLPRLNHPLFAVPAFAERASQDGFFLCIEATDPRFDGDQTREWLVSQHPMAVTGVPS